MSSSFDAKAAFSTLEPCKVVTIGFIFFRDNNLFRWRFCLFVGKVFAVPFQAGNFDKVGASAPDESKLAEGHEKEPGSNDAHRPEWGGIEAETKGRRKN